MLVSEWVESYDCKTEVHDLDVTVFVDEQVFGFEIAVSIASSERTKEQSNTTECLFFIE